MLFSVVQPIFSEADSADMVFVYFLPTKSKSLRGWSGIKFLSKKLKSKDCFFLCSKGREIKIVKFRRGWILCTSLFSFTFFYSSLLSFILFRMQNYSNTGNNLEKNFCKLFVIRLLIVLWLSHQLPFPHYPQKSVPPAGREQPVEKYDACR